MILKPSRAKLITVILFMAGLSLSSNRISSQTTDPDENSNTQATVASFEYFFYKGTDRFYEENPLPGEDYFYNPILPGWNSDPSICFDGEDYFLVTSSFVYFPGVPIFHSKDLLNWKQIGFVLDRPSQLVNFERQRTSQGIFAPAISYNPHNDTYYMITTNVGAGNFYVKTKDPFGSWSEPVWLRDVHGIDPSFFFDDDGKVYILNNDAPEGKALYDGHRAIWIREFDLDSNKVVGSHKVLIDGGVRPEEKPIWIEGPHMYKINGEYLLMDAEGGTGPMHSEVILKGDSPMGDFIPWEKNPILTQRHLDPNRPDPITCAGHADLVKDKNGNWWSVFLACRPLDNKFENLGRETFLMPVRWSEDGYPFMTEGDELIPMIVKMEGVQRKDEVSFGNFERMEAFNDPALGVEWFTLRTPATDRYSLTEKPGYLTLDCADVNTMETKTPAFVARRLQHHNFVGETRLLFEPQNENETAGLLLYKDELHQYYLAVKKAGSERKVCLDKISRDGAESLGEQVVPAQKAIRLKVASRGTQFDFYYAIEDGDWVLLSENIDAFYLSTANSFGFTGTTLGMYATQKPFAAFSFRQGQN